jgi:hypothetical protein
MLALFHGTTLASAEQILREGWIVKPPRETVTDVALEYGEDPAIVINELERRDRFAVGERRGEWASFSLDELTTVHSWAQRAPEVRWESLWAIWRLNHPEVPYEVKGITRGGVTKDVDYLPRPGVTWVFQQMRHEELAVLKLKISYDSLVKLGATTEGFENKTLPTLRELTSRAPGVAIPAPFRPSRSRVELRRIDRDLPWTVFAELLGLDDEEFQRRDRSGDFGPRLPDSVRPRDAEVWPCWSLRAVEDLLPEPTK